MELRRRWLSRTSAAISSATPRVVARARHHAGRHQRVCLCPLRPRPLCGGGGGVGAYPPVSAQRRARVGGEAALRRGQIALRRGQIALRRGQIALRRGQIALRHWWRGRTSVGCSTRCRDTERHRLAMRHAQRRCEPVVASHRKCHAARSTARASARRWRSASEGSSRRRSLASESGVGASSRWVTYGSSGSASDGLWLASSVTIAR